MNRKNKTLTWSHLLSQLLKDKEIMQKEKFEKEFEEEMELVPDFDKAILKSIFDYNKIDNEETYRSVKATYEFGVDSLLSFAGVVIEEDTLELIDHFLESLIYDYEQRNIFKNSH